MKKVLKKSDFWTAVLFTMFGIFFLIVSTKMDPQITAYPKIVLSLLVLLSALLLLKSPRTTNPSEEISREKLKKTAFILVIITSYILVMKWIGFILSSVIFLFLLMTFVGSRWHWGWRLIASFLTIGAIYLIFAKVFYVPLP